MKFVENEFQFLIGNVLAKWEIDVNTIQEAVSIPYRQCLSAEFGPEEPPVPLKFQFLIGNVLAQLYILSRSLLFFVSIPYRQCLS